MPHRYTLVSFLNARPDGDEFLGSNWPPHVTLVLNFSIEQSVSALTAAIEGALGGVPVLAAPAEGEELFGPHRDIPVSVLVPTPGLLALHSRLLGVLTEAGACFEKAEYVGSGYRPHVTITPQRRLHRGEVVVVGSVSLVDLEPGEDTRQRGVLATIPLHGA